MSGFRRYRNRRGQYTRTTPERVFGLHVDVCPNPACRRLQPYKLDEKRPERCHACGTPLSEDRDSPR